MGTSYLNYFHHGDEKLDACWLYIESFRPVPSHRDGVQNHHSQYESRRQEKTGYELAPISGTLLLSPWRWFNLVEEGHRGRLGQRRHPKQIKAWSYGVNPGWFACREGTTRLHAEESKPHPTHQMQAT